MLWWTSDILYQGFWLTINTLHAGKNFQQMTFWNFFLNFLENRIWHFMQKDNLHEVSDPIFYQK